MQLTNQTSATYILPGPPDGDELVLNPSPGTLTVSNAQYATDDKLAGEVNRLVAAGHATVTGAPAGFPRSTGRPTIKLVAGESFSVSDHTGAKIFEVRDDGSTHTHGAVVADL